MTTGVGEHRNGRFEGVKSDAPGRSCHAPASSRSSYNTPLYWSSHRPVDGSRCSTSSSARSRHTKRFTSTCCARVCLSTVDTTAYHALQSNQLFALRLALISIPLQLRRLQLELQAESAVNQTIRRWTYNHTANGYREKTRPPSPDAGTRASAPLGLPLSTRQIQQQ